MKLKLTIASVANNYFQDRLYSVMKQYHYSGDTVAERQAKHCTAL